MASPPARPQPLGRILETSLYVDDLAAAETFYGGVLGLQLDSRREGSFAFFRVGASMLLLFDPAQSRDVRGVPAHGATGPGHACFAVSTAEFGRWETWLLDRGVPIEHRQDWPHGGRSFYFRDPTGNSLELATPQIWGMPDHG